MDKDEIYLYCIEGLGKNLIFLVIDFNCIDCFMKVIDEDSVYMVCELVIKEGFFFGYISGVVM